MEVIFIFCVLLFECWGKKLSRNVTFGHPSEMFWHPPPLLSDGFLKKWKFCAGRIPKIIRSLKFIRKSRTISPPPFRLDVRKSHCTTVTNWVYWFLISPSFPVILKDEGNFLYFVFSYSSVAVIEYIFFSFFFW